ncbi:hypothetical protein [Photobacterium lutimaris]|uniref:Uncharacterized protein n=1 Tax=Photobacterium lutimaris TaxID=388278 RepID=A0A2T3ITX9_9GAMM|nr:hypothetical protein [Photobacterium lutimaris]PSU31817.1 hypothetical protein C9I99_21775 [Photobacterium lutimaris]TDR72531.1 hypothetical protein DFP78_1137 [Photobacterium lutimaris]
MLNNHHIETDVSGLNYHVLATFNSQAEREVYVRELRDIGEISNAHFCAYNFKQNTLKFNPVDLDALLSNLHSANLLIPFYGFFLGQALDPSKLADAEPTPATTNDIMSCLCESSLGQSSIDALVDRVAVVSMLLNSGQVSDDYWAPIINVILMLDNIADSVTNETVIAIENTEVLDVIFPKCWRTLERSILQKRDLKLAIHKMITHTKDQGYSHFVDGVTQDKTNTLEIELKVRQCVDSWLVTTYIPYDTTPAIVDLLLLGRFKKRYEKKSHLHATQIAKLGAKGISALDKIIKYHKSPAVSTELNKLAEKVTTLAYSDSCLA